MERLWWSFQSVFRLGAINITTMQIAKHVLIALVLTGILSLSASANPVRRDHIDVELVAATTSVEPGRTLTVALRLKPDEHWHTYWKNPGDSGLATQIEWELPEGFKPADYYKLKR